MFMIEPRYHPHTFRAVQTALSHVGVVHYGPGVSSGPLSPSQVDAVERHLELCVSAQGLRMTEHHVHCWLQAGAGSSTVMRRSLAAEQRNGAEIRADLALLLEMAVEGDL